MSLESVICRKILDQKKGNPWVCACPLCQRERRSREYKSLIPAVRAKLVLQLKPLIAAKAKEKQIEGGKEKVPQKSAKPPTYLKESFKQGKKRKKYDLKCN
jgi:hypothetical protein